jgi:hypothetical protein
MMTVLCVYVFVSQNASQLVCMYASCLAVGGFWLRHRACPCAYIHTYVYIYNEILII